MKPKVYYRRDPAFLVGPLGYWEVGDRIEGTHDTLIVCSVDLDGMAWAFREGFVFERGERVTQELEGDFSEAEVIKRGMQSLAKVHTPTGILNERQREQCRNIAAHGRRLRSEHDIAGAAR